MQNMHINITVALAKLSVEYNQKECKKRFKEAYPFITKINLNTKEKEDAIMEKSNIERAPRSRVTYEKLEEFVRMKAQQFIQVILEKELPEYLGRGEM